jgi:hypothetical protein
MTTKTRRFERRLLSSSNAPEDEFSLLSNRRVYLISDNGGSPNTQQLCITRMCFFSVFVYHTYFLTNKLPSNAPVILSTAFRFQAKT